ncbi:MAG TPA: YggS family pyridoxal phosphate-dependent enzyme, partial [Thermodesulfovibrionales bacterium]|nr:YggS family pyridoxal phosphate-dependent enzyme [Thermodesulfovibrionales bacterium]
SHAAMRAGREPGDVKLIAVTKTVGIESIREAINAGLRVFGENRVQEAQEKLMSDELKVMSERIEWHLIGHLQRNKAKYAVRLFDLIHSVDSVELAGEIDRSAEKNGKIQDVLVEVKLSHERTKHGVSRTDLTGLLKEVAGFKHLNLVGLMTIPPFFDNPEDARPYFRELRNLRDEAVSSGFALPQLSMGMSGDFEVAIEEGATMVRVGTAIFGERK